MPDQIVHDTPVPGALGDEFWGSDLIAEVLRELAIPYLAFVPGSSYRGLHDSIVNHLGNRAPQLLLAIHEESAVAIAHGYAKVSGRMMAAGLHGNIGLLRAPMAIYNAWCDRAPVLLLGASGPWDASRRRPTDWIHTSADQGGLIRDFTKWDNQPGSPAAAVEALLRAAQIAQTAPQGPVYVNLVSDIQEQSIGAMPPLPDVARYPAPPPVYPAPELVAAAAKLLSEASSPVILLGRCSRDLEDWKARVALAERLGAPVMTHLRFAAAFPTDHRLHPVSPVLRSLPPAGRNLVAEADVVLALDWPDLADALGGEDGAQPARAKVIRVSCDAHSHRGWSAEHRALPPSDLYLLCETDAAVRMLLETTRPRAARAALPAVAPSPELPAELSLAHIAVALESCTQGIDVCYTRLPLTWRGSYAHFRHPLDYIGYDGGSGVGSGPGITVGAGLALQGSGRIPIAMLGDGDFLMGNTAIWTAAHYAIPCLLIVYNNRSFNTDEAHQRKLARDRGRPQKNQWIGTRIEAPEIDIAEMARSQGATGIGPVTQVGEIQPAIEQGIAAVRAGRVCVIDARVTRRHDDPLPEKRDTRKAAMGFLDGLWSRRPGGR
ncbi:MAG TPA: thiamine pyrophosphate-dependent enzyme [Myxococcota bacterium]|jgi:thiamine pyrophosphate-dependent acetolactate synthase large subunit-like protein